MGVTSIEKLWEKFAIYDLLYGVVMNRSEKQEATMNDVDVSLKAEADCVVPITPDVVIENGDFDFQSTPMLTVVTKQLNQVSIDSESSPRTPKDDVFDPYAPGPYDNIPRCAPHSNKNINEFRNAVVRRLNFHHHPPPPQEQPIVSDQDIFASMHQTLVQFIVSKQAEEAQFDDDGCRTPPSPLLRFSVADTCPAAPLKLKPPTKIGIIQLDLCKKLDF